MATVTKRDTDGTKTTTLGIGQLGMDAYLAGGDLGRMSIGDGQGGELKFAFLSELADIINGTTPIELKTVNGLSLIGTGNVSIGGSMAAPSITITTSVNENSQVIGTIDNYDTNVTYYIGATNGRINGGYGVQIVGAPTFTFDAEDITDGDNDTDEITAYYTFESSISNSTVLPMTIVFVSVVADTATSTPITITGDLIDNDGWENV